MGFFDKSIDTEFAPIRNISKKMPVHSQATGFLQELYGQDVEYPRRKIVGMSQPEEEGQSLLGRILSGQAFADPRTSPAYQGFREESKRVTEEGASAMRHRQNMGGMFRSGTAGKQEGDFRANMGAKELSFLGQLYERERERDNPYTRLMASSKYGALPRLLEQATMDSEYQAALSELLAPYQLQAPLAQTLLGSDPMQTANTFIGPSTADKWQQGMSMGGDVATMLAALSDNRLKSNILYVDGPWATWTWKPEAAQFGLSGNGSGLIAQDVLGFAPHAVLRHPSGYLMINYAVL